MSQDPRYSKPDMYIVTPRVPRQPAGLKNYFTEMTRKAEEMGYDRAWNIETNDRDAFAQSVLMALGASRIRVGTNIVSVFSHTPTLLAMGAFTLDEVSGGRFILGIGPGGTQIITHGHGVPFGRPVRRVRETLEIVRPLLRGERVTYKGKIFDIQRGFRLRLGVEGRRVPIYISAINPKMLQLAGEMADGVIMTHLPLEALDDVKKNIAVGAERAGRDPAEVHVLANQPVGVHRGDGPTNLRKAVCWHLASETFDWFVGHTPWGELRERVRKLWWEGRREEAAALAEDGFVETFGLGYKDDVIQERIVKHLEAGVVPVLDVHGVRKGHEEEDTLHVLRLGTETFR
ncbi:MAG: LLM class flavin-dependent oxidoreductase [Nitrospinota bacterium]